ATQSQHPSTQPVRLPNLFALANLALRHGEVEGLTGLRHYSSLIPLYWDKTRGPDTRAPVFHAYGLGGAGVTLAPAVAEQVSLHITPEIIKPSPDHKKHEIVILGAGYTGLFAALSLRKDLNSRGRQDISIRIISYSLPRGCSRVIPNTREPTLADNYPSQIAGGLVMPFSIGKMLNPEQWPELLQRSHNLWEKYSQDPNLGQAVQKKQAIVLPAVQKPEQSRTETIDGINQLYSAPLFQKHHGPELIRAVSGEKNTLQSIVYENLIQVETSSVLLHFLKQAIEQNIVITQLDEPLSSYQELSQHFNADTKTFIINASGHGAEAVFGHPASLPIRGDLLVLKIPVSHIPQEMLHILNYCYLSNAYYLFIRHELERPWIHLVLGGSCIENDSDLSLHRGTLRDILNYWLDLFHLPANNSDSDAYPEKKRAIIETLIKTI
ncbi:FAD-dependent oxidoreductase, partial [Sansalvadorimonas verongulae]|uniref:FAD-dependent oxidoreductase n=1 Tax=Sansalvadorimonas verongulae TaxID=2172824 RepID=UPI0012BBBA27